MQICGPFHVPRYHVCGLLRGETLFKAELSESPARSLRDGDGFSGEEGVVFVVRNDAVVWSFGGSVIMFSATSV